MAAKMYLPIALFRKMKQISYNHVQDIEDVQNLRKQDSMHAIMMYCWRT